MRNLINSKILDKSEPFFEILKEEILSAKQLADRLGCSLSYVKKLRKQKKIHPEIKLGRFVRYNLRTVIEALQKRSLL